MPIAGDRIRGFDGLRAVAFLLVFTNHKVQFAYGDACGVVGLGLFFVLSGFLITRILARSREDIEHGQASIAGSLRRFYWRRAARILPVYYALLAVITVASLFMTIDYFGRNEQLAYWFYATNLLVAHRGAWIGDFGHLWSLAVEEQFYLLFAPLILLLPRTYAIAACLACMAAGLAARIGLGLADAPVFSIYTNSFVNFAMLGFGGAIGLLAARAMPRPLVSGWLLIASFCLYLALPVMLVTWSQVWMLIGTWAVAPFAGLLLIQTFHRQDSRLVAVLESAPLRGIGRVSYGAYLFHPFVHFSAIEAIAQRAGIWIAAPRPMQVAAELAVSLALAATSWLCLERPLLAWAKGATPADSMFSHSRA
jgi:peptidoglycan/LPS O-acetylase OafA/YrhL